MKAKKRVEFVIYGLHPALFCSEVDQYFICPICYFVASDPIMCKSCEQIYCKGCISRYSQIKEPSCRVCKSFLQTIPLRKFPSKVYHSFFLYCPNYNSGCRYEGGIQEIHEHKDSCEFKKLSCQNPLCAHNFLAKDRKIENNEVCSEQCLEAYLLSQMLGRESRVEICKFFWKCVQEHKKVYADKIEKDFQELCKTEQETKTRHEEEIKELEDRLNEYKWNIHIGKYQNNVWTCCQQDKSAVGCSPLQRT